jgi:hypothetical protein
MLDQISRELRHDLRGETLGCLIEVCADSALALQNEEHGIARALRPKYVALMDAMDRLGWEEGSDPLVRTFDAPGREALVFLAEVSPTAAALLAEIDTLAVS